MDYSRNVPSLIPTKAPVKDQALSTLVKFANAGATFGITLVVDGQVVYGDLISGKDYCEAMRQRFDSSGGSRALSEAIADYFQELGNESYDKANVDEIPLNYLHLINTAFMKGDGYAVNVKGAFFRVAIDRVSAFAPGRPDS